MLIPGASRGAMQRYFFPRHFDGSGESDLPGHGGSHQYLGHGPASHSEPAEDGAWRGRVPDRGHHEQAKREDQQDQGNQTHDYLLLDPLPKG